MSTTRVKFKEQQTVIIEMPKWFNYEKVEEFMELVQAHPKGTIYVLDFKETEYVDSSSLGALLSLRMYWSRHVTFKDPKEHIREIFESANFVERLRQPIKRQSRRRHQAQTNFSVVKDESPELLRHVNSIAMKYQ